MNAGLKNLLKRIFVAAFGLFCYAFGLYLTIQANIGVSPWDCVHIGMANTLGIRYGSANIITSLMILAVDILLREKIGIGMILDALLVGRFVDFFNWLGLFDFQSKLIISLLLMAAGLFIMGFSQYLYMKTALGCGPRDSLLVGLSRRAEKVPIGVVSVFILTAAVLLGYVLGGPIGIGTLMCAILQGPVMQLCFKAVKFDAAAVKHQDILTALRTAFSGMKK